MAEEKSLPAPAPAVPPTKPTDARKVRLGKAKNIPFPARPVEAPAVIPGLDDAILPGDVAIIYQLEVRTRERTIYKTFDQRLTIPGALNRMTAKAGLEAVLHFMEHLQSSVLSTYNAFFTEIFPDAVKARTPAAEFDLLEEPKLPENTEAFFSEPATAPVLPKNEEA